MKQRMPEKGNFQIKLSKESKFTDPILKNLTPNLITELNIDGQLYLVLSVDSENKKVFTYECLYINSLKYKIIGEMRIYKKRSIIVQPEDDYSDKNSAKKIKISTDILTKRELQVVSLVAEGLVNKQIANQLNISEWTVSTHLRRIYAKLGVDSRASMIYYCSNIIEPFKKRNALD